MTAYIIRRILLMIPTLLGIMLVSFVVVQFAPGGPVERVIAQLRAPTPARPRASPARRAAISARAARCRAARRSTRSARNIAAPRASTPNSSRAWRSSSASTSRRYERFLLMLWNYIRFDFGKSYFRDDQVHRADQGEAAGLDVARHLDDAAHLPDLDPARHPQGGPRRLALRHLDLRRHHHRLCDSRASCSRSC